MTPTSLPDLRMPPLRIPSSGDHRIALVGAGAIGRLQLNAYRKAGWQVVAICDTELAAARLARDEFYPQAEVTNDFGAVLRRPDVTVVDLAVHVDIRPDMVRAALVAGKHVMSQKPFVENLADGRRLADLADELGVKLAVNQNGRWAPHFHALRDITERALGDLQAADFAAYWPHDVHCELHRLGQERHLVLYDFAIHWFDLVACLMADRAPTAVHAITGVRQGQLVPVPTLASVMIDYGSAQIGLLMRASARHEDTGTCHLLGSRASLRMQGTALGASRLEVLSENGSQTLEIQGTWFPDALIGSMADLLRAIEDDDEPSANARSSLAGLQLCFAAIEAAETGRGVDPSDVDSLHGASR